MFVLNYASPKRFNSFISETKILIAVLTHADMFIYFMRYVIYKGITSSLCGVDLHKCVCVCHGNGKTLLRILGRSKISNGLPMSLPFVVSYEQFPRNPCLIKSCFCLAHRLA